MAATVQQIRPLTPAETLEQTLRDLKAEVRNLEAEVRALQTGVPAPVQERAARLELDAGALVAAFNIGWDRGRDFKLQVVS